MNTTLRNLVFGAMTLAAANATAHTVTYNATLDGSLTGSSGSGTATVIIDYDLLTMQLSTTFADLTGTTSAAHIHCCTAAPNTGNAGVATQLPSFTGFPAGVTSGSYDMSFDMSDATSWNASFINSNGGTTLSALNTLGAALDSGNAYLNIHTSTFGAGEIRGYFAPAPVPVPAALWLMAPAVAGMFARRFRKQ
ncbi:MAG: CHRD domain-containing protein [Gammaproteobacteria bacterium]|nr:CHRD domain-containing protein [Gammaproteobacteria bacterium]